MFTVLKLLLVAVMLQIARTETCTTDSHTKQVRTMVMDVTPDTVTPLLEITITK